MNLEQQLRAADRHAVALDLSEGIVLVEFIRLRVCNFKAVPARGELQWKPGRYIAFALAGGAGRGEHDRPGRGRAARPADRRLPGRHHRRGRDRRWPRHGETAGGSPPDRVECCRPGPASGLVRSADSGPRGSDATADRSRRRSGATPLRGPAHRRRPPPDRRLSDQLPDLRPRRAPVRLGGHRPARRAAGRRRPGLRSRDSDPDRTRTDQARLLVPPTRPWQASHRDAEAIGPHTADRRVLHRPPLARPGPRPQRLSFPSPAGDAGRGRANRHSAGRLPLARRRGP